ncbi:MAG: M23 family metallopeptidase, partial [Acidimicrobiales bacterium]
LQARNVELLVAQAELDDAEFLAMIYAQAVVDARQKVEVASERLRRQIVATYVNGGADASVLEALLKARSGEEMGQALTYSKAVVGDTEVLVENLERARAEARKADGVAKANSARAKSRRDDVDAARRFIAAARDNQARLVDEINVQVMLESQALMEVQGRRALVEGRINVMSASSDGVALLLGDLQRSQPDWMPGRYPITNPLPGYRIGSAFGMRFHPILNIERLHAGGDMGAPSGTPIHAAADGRVVVASERGGYGLTVVIDHGDSLATLYAHQSALAVGAGDLVKRGDVIGWVGSTGLSTGPHLHLETRVKGMPVNPEGIIDFEAAVDYGRN